MSGEIERLTLALRSMPTVSGNGSDPIVVPAYIRREDLEFALARVAVLLAAIGRVL